MHPSATNHHLAALARGNHGLILARAAREAGISDSALRRRLANGMLEPVGTGLHRLAGTPVSWHQRALAAVLLAGPEAVLSHRAAASLWGLDGVAGRPIEVVTPHRRRRATGGPGRSRVHESRDLADEDRAEHRGIPCTSVPRTLLDLSAVLHPFRLEQALEDALRKRLCTVDQLADRFAHVARRGRPGTKAMRALLASRTGAYTPTMSELERRMARLLDRRGLPHPVRQHVVRLGDTTAHLDFAWPELLVAVECDGLFHHRHNQRLPWDQRRQNELVLRGWIVLRFTWRQLTEEPDVVAAHIVAAHRRRRSEARPASD